MCIVLSGMIEMVQMCFRAFPILHAYFEICRKHFVVVGQYTLKVPKCEIFDFTECTNNY
jgi:hypothetical protein